MPLSDTQEISHYWNMKPLENYNGPVGAITIGDVKGEGETDLILDSFDLYFAPNLSIQAGEAFYTTEANELGTGYDQMLISNGWNPADAESTIDWWISAAYDQITGKGGGFDAIPVGNAKPKVGKYFNNQMLFVVALDFAFSASQGAAR